MYNRYLCSQACVFSGWRYNHLKSVDFTGRAKCSILTHQTTTNIARTIFQTKGRRFVMKSARNQFHFELEMFSGVYALCTILPSILFSHKKFVVSTTFSQCSTERMNRWLYIQAPVLRFEMKIIFFFSLCYHVPDLSTFLWIYFVFFLSTSFNSICL